MLIDDLSVVESMVAEVEEQAVKLRQESLDEGLLSPDFPIPYITWPELLDDFHDHAMLELGHSTALAGNGERVHFICIRHRTEIRRKVETIR